MKIGIDKRLSAVQLGSFFMPKNRLYKDGGKRLLKPIKNIPYITVRTVKVGAL